jgi:hypothetical protein
MIPLVLVVLGGLITLVGIIPAVWVRTLYRFTPTVRQRAIAGVLGPCMALLGAFDWSLQIAEPGSHITGPDQPRPAPPPHSLNKRMDDEIQKAWTELKDGRIAYEPSRTMTEGTPEIVRVRIARGDSIDVASNFSDRVWVERLKTSAFMTAVLVADANDFDVKGLSSDSQALVGDFTDWVWSVTPLRDGALTLSIRVTARVRLSDGSSETHDLLVKDTPITVRSNPRWRLSRFWNRNWQWMLGSPIVLGVLGWLGSRIAKRRRTERRAGF